MPETRADREPPQLTAPHIRTILSQHGYRLTGLRAFDLFPMTHHVECVAILHPERPS